MLQLLFLTALVDISALVSINFVYHAHINMTIYLQELVERYPNKVHLYSIGFSTQGRDLWAVALSSQTPNLHEVLKPEVKIVGNIHGSEVLYD